MRYGAEGIGNTTGRFASIVLAVRLVVGPSAIGDASVLDAGRLDALYGEMEAEGRTRLAETAFEGERRRRSADMR